MKSTREAVLIVMIREITLKENEGQIGLLGLSEEVLEYADRRRPSPRGGSRIYSVR